jgi:hypothetical protein
MPFALKEAIAVLERTPATIAALLADLPDGWVTCDEGPDTFSPYVVVGHLIHGERTDWIPRARMILERGEAATFEPYDRFAQYRESAGKSLATLLEEFATLRRENLTTVHGFRLTATDLERRGRHPALGPVTLGQLLATWVVHDLGHIGQITRVMAKRYKADVGPWVEYLPVLTRY